MRHVVVLLAFVALLTAASSSAQAVVVAGDNSGGPITITNHPGDRNSGFNIQETVIYDPGGGAWHKELQNVGTGPGLMLPSGQGVDIDETFVNGGVHTWTDWHEMILSTTDLGGGPNYPGFLFTNGSLNVFRNGGLLAEGTDYMLMTDTYMNQVSPGGDWSVIWITFSPGASIQVGDTLRITKQIFEVYGDGNIWATGEVALVAQYPTVPEPPSLMLAVVGLASLIGCWRGRNRRAGQ